MLYVKVDGWLSALGSTMTSQSDLWFRDEYFFCATEQQMRNSERIEMNWTWNTAAKPERTPLEDRVSFQSYFCCILLGRHQPNYCVMCQNLPGVWQQLITACSKTESWKLKSNTQHGWHKIYGKASHRENLSPDTLTKKITKIDPKCNIWHQQKAWRNSKLWICWCCVYQYVLCSKSVIDLFTGCAGGAARPFEYFWFRSCAACVKIYVISQSTVGYINGWIQWWTDWSCRHESRNMLLPRVFRIIFNVIFNCSIDLMQVAKSQAF